jgi:hypothetical protein
MVELALVMPVLIMLVVLVADFGRVFAASLSMEAAARNAAEAMANAYLANPPGPPGDPASVRLSTAAPTGDDAYYADLHKIGVNSICDEMADQANTAYDSVTSTCAGMPLIRMCIHDNEDTRCSIESQGVTSIPAECSEIGATMTNANDGAGTPRWTEVRVCYRFTPILANLPFLSFADIWLQRGRAFTIPCYFALGSAECG